MTLRLIRDMAALAPDWQFILLTSARVHHELASLERPNVRRLCLEHAGTGPSVNTSETTPRAGLLQRWKRHAALIPLRLIYSYLFRRPRRLTLLADQQVDLLFFPLTSPQFHEPGIPSVAVVYDLQHLTYPKFFPLDDRLERSRHLSRVAKLTDRVVCISDYSRNRILENVDIAAEKVQRIYIGLENSPVIPPETVEVVLERHSLTARQYYLYPANTWAHKNHLRLFDGFARYVARNPHDPVRLVCTGADTGRLSSLQRTLGRLNVGKHVLMTGYLSETELSVLYSQARALVFPSLYEGFGMPVAEAMARGVPVLCSNVTSLPEISASAALTFDPTQPQEMALAMERLEADPALRAELIAAGYARAAALGSTRHMASQYLELFAATSRSSTPAHPQQVRRRTSGSVTTTV